MKIKTVQSIDSFELDELVEKTYGRPYCYQQQDGCKDRGVESLTVPVPFPEDFENTTIPEKVNGEVMGVSLASWLARDPHQKLVTGDDWDREHGLVLFWQRNFYPHIDVVVNDLHAKGLLPAGEYQLVIDW